MAPALLLMTLCLGALGDEPGPMVICTQPNVTSDCGAPALWVDAIRDACDALQRSDAVDRTAWVRVTSALPDVVLNVVTANGREAVRRVSEPGSVRGTLEALLILPIASAPKPVAPTEALPEPPTHVAEPPPLDHASDHQEFATEVGLGFDGRLATQGRAIFGPAAFVAVRADAWLFGASLRWDALENNADNIIEHYEAQGVALGLTLGRRVNDGFVTIDCAVEPRFVSIAQSHGESADEHRSTTTDFFVGALARAAIGHGKLRPYVQADVEAAPARLKRRLDSDSIYTAVPSWSAGLTAGLRWTLE